MRKLMMLAAHEPSLDPRIKWEAHSASREYDVTVVGFNDNPEKQHKDATFKTIRLERNLHQGLFTFIVEIKKILESSLKIRALYFLSLIALFFLGPPFIITQKIAMKLKDIIRKTDLFKTLLKSILFHEKLVPAYSTIAKMYSIAAIYYGTCIHFITTGSVFWKYIERNQHPDIIHCNDLDTLIVGVIAKRKFGTKIIYDAHEFWPYSSTQTPKLLVTLLKLYENFLIKYPDSVITVNHYLADAMKQEYDLNYIHSIPNCEPWHNSSSNPTHVDFSACNFSQCKVKFLYQGNFYRGRGIEVLINTWKELNPKEASLFIRGTSSKHYHECLLLAEETKLLNKSIFFLDAVREDELVSAASFYDVGIIPYEPVSINNRFSCPNKLSQYMHAGLAIISNKLDYVSEILTLYNIGVIYDSSKPITLINAFQFYINNPSQLSLHKKNALNAAENHFNWQVQEKILLQIYHDLYPFDHK